jgi:hypothetical protein
MAALGLGFAPAVLCGLVALGIAGWAIVEGRRTWAGRSCGC